MQDVMTSLVNQYGYAAIVCLIFIETVFPPIPSEAVLLFGGFLTTCTLLSPWWVIACATLGSVLGAVLLYAAGHWVGKQRLYNLVNGRAGRFLHLNLQDINKADLWFERYQTRAVLFGRCIPIVRSLVSIPAGISGMAFVPFLLFTAAGSTAWNTLLVWSGRFAGAAWQQSLAYFGWYTKAAALLLCAGAAVVIALRLKKRRSPHGGGNES